MTGEIFLGIAAVIFGFAVLKELAAIRGHNELITRQLKQLNDSLERVEKSIEIIGATAENIDMNIDSMERVARRRNLDDEAY